MSRTFTYDHTVLEYGFNCRCDTPCWGLRTSQRVSYGARAMPAGTIGANHLKEFMSCSRIGVGLNQAGVQN
jgi:hypothetical protein